ncbi:FHA domain-containing protein [Cellulomonas sp. 179-A 9B4 NHS]
MAIGRNPAPVDGRRPIAVTSPGRLLSRTHVLVDVDEHGRVLVTDYNSGNGTEAQTDPPRQFEPNVAYVVESGTTLLLGDVTCAVELTRPTSAP